MIYTDKYQTFVCIVVDDMESHLFTQGKEYRIVSEVSRFSVLTVSIETDKGTLPLDTSLSEGVCDFSTEDLHEVCRSRFTDLSSVEVIQKLAEVGCHYSEENEQLKVVIDKYEKICKDQQTLIKDYM